MRRTAFLATAAAAVAAPSVTRAAGPLRIMTLPIDLGGEPFYAQDLGLFKKANLDVEIQIAKYGTEVAAAVTGGSIDIGQSNIMSLAIAVDKGVPFLLTYGAGLYSSNKPTSMMIVLKDSPLKTARDLSGKTVAVNGLRSITEISVRAWVDANGGDSNAVKFIEMPFVEMEPALVANRIDAALLADPDATTALAAGHTRPFAKAFDAIAKQFLIGGWFAKSEWIAANGDLIRRYNAVMREAAQWGNNPSNYAQSAAILQKYTKVAVGKANRIIYAEKLDPALIQPNIDVAAKYGLIKASFPASKMISNVA